MIRTQSFYLNRYIFWQLIQLFKQRERDVDIKNM